MTKMLIAGNWKMNLSAEKSVKLAKSVEKDAVGISDAVDVVVCPSALAVAPVAGAVKDLAIGVQNIYFADEGAFTGEISAAQASEYAKYAIVGHSERRHVFGETNEMVARKSAACLRSGLTPIICIGETQHEREENETKQVLNDQLATGLTMLTSEDIPKVVIAYEPVWAIGTGNNATPDQVSGAVEIIRSCVKEMFGASAASGLRLLYGGSVVADTAGAYLSVDGIDGLLVGGASLNSHEFNAIVKRAADGKS